MVFGLHTSAPSSSATSSSTTPTPSGHNHHHFGISLPRRSSSSNHHHHAHNDHNNDTLALLQGENEALKLQIADWRVKWNEERDAWHHRQKLLNLENEQLEKRLEVLYGSWEEERQALRDHIASLEEKVGTETRLRLRAEQREEQLQREVCELPKVIPTISREFEKGLLLGGNNERFRLIKQLQSKWDVKSPTPSADPTLIKTGSIMSASLLGDRAKVDELQKRCKAAAFPREESDVVSLPGSNAGLGGMGILASGAARISPTKVYKGSSLDWSPLDASTFEVRVGPNYKRHKKKAPSGPSICTLLTTEIYHTPTKVTHLLAHIDPPSVTATPGFLFVVNIMLPLYSPSLRTFDGPGFSLVLFLHIAPPVFETLKTATKGHLELLRRFIEEEGNDDDDALITNRFKMIGRIPSSEHVKLTGVEFGLFSTFNSKPVFTHPQQEVHHGANYLEIDIDVHQFGLIARKGWHTFLKRTAKPTIDLAFVIEAQTDEELPEVILGAAQLKNLRLVPTSDLVLLAPPITNRTISSNSLSRMGSASPSFRLELLSTPTPNIIATPPSLRFSMAPPPVSEGGIAVIRTDSPSVLCPPTVLDVGAVATTTSAKDTTSSINALSDTPNPKPQPLLMDFMATDTPPREVSSDVGSDTDLEDARHSPTACSTAAADSEIHEPGSGAVTPSAIPVAKLLPVKVTELLVEKIAASSGRTSPFAGGIRLETHLENGMPHSWFPANSTDFSLRVGPNYKKNHKKAPCQTVIGTPASVDLFVASSKRCNIAMDPTLKILENCKGPYTFVVNCLLPNYTPSLRATADGPGYSLVLCFEVSAETMQAAKATSSGHLGLFARFISGTEKELYERFKMVGRLVNTSEVDLGGAESSLVSKYNAKPVLTDPQHHIFHGPNYTEVDVDVHTFGLIARKGLHSLLPRMKQLVLDIGFTIEARADDEMPEALIGCVRVNKLDLEKAIHLNG